MPITTFSSVLLAPRACSCPRALVLVLQRFLFLQLCRFSAAGMTVSPRAPRAGGRKAPKHEIAGWEWRWCRNYGDFAAGSGVDVVERGGNVRNFATRHGVN